LDEEDHAIAPQAQGIPECIISRSNAAKVEIDEPAVEDDDADKLGIDFPVTPTTPKSRNPSKIPQRIPDLAAKDRGECSPRDHLAKEYMEALNEGIDNLISLVLERELAVARTLQGGDKTVLCMHAKAILLSM